MINETVVTVQGNLGGEVVVRQAGESRVAHFRMACTPRKLNRSTGQWSDDETQWYSVSAWRALGDNCARSLRRGDPVVVHGRLSHRSYVNAQGVEVLSLEIDAAVVAHDLNRGTSSFARPPRPTPQPRSTTDVTTDVTADVDEEPAA